MGVWCSRLNPIPVERMPARFQIRRKPHTFEETFDTAFHKEELERARRASQSSLVDARREEEHSEDDVSDAVEAVLSDRQRNLVKLLSLPDASTTAKTADVEGNTLLHYAADCGASNCATVLVLQGADVNARNSAMLTPLHMAIMSKHRDLVRRFVSEFRADLNAAEQEGWTALHLCAHNGDVDNIELMLKHGADANVVNKNDDTPYDIAMAVCAYLKKARHRNHFMKEYEERHGERHRAAQDLLWEVKRASMENETSQHKVRKVDSIRNLFKGSKDKDASPSRSGWRHRRAISVTIPEHPNLRRGSWRSRGMTTGARSDTIVEESFLSLGDGKDKQEDGAPARGDGEGMDEADTDECGDEDGPANGNGGSDDSDDCESVKPYMSRQSTVDEPIVPRKESQVDLELEEIGLDLERGAHLFEPLTPGSPREAMDMLRATPDLKYHLPKPPSPEPSPQEKHDASLAIFEDTHVRFTPVKAPRAKAIRSVRDASETPELFRAVVKIGEHDRSEQNIGGDGSPHRKGVSPPVLRNKPQELGKVPHPEGDPHRGPKVRLVYPQDGEEENVESQV